MSYKNDRFKNVYLAMPILHTLILFAIVGQLHFFLQLDSDLAKFIRLFWRALSDMKSFIIIELIIIAMMAAVM